MKEWPTVEVTVEDTSDSYRTLTDRILTRWTLAVLCFQDGCLLSRLLPLHQQWNHRVKEGKWGWLPLTTWRAGKRQEHSNVHTQLKEEKNGKKLVMCEETKSCPWSYLLMRQSSEWESPSKSSEQKKMLSELAVWEGEQRQPRPRLREHSDGRSNPDAQGHSAFSRVSCITAEKPSQTSSLLSRLWLRQQLLHHYFIPSHSPLCFKSNVKQKLISQPFILPHFILQTSKSHFRLSPHDKLHTPENWFFQRSSLTLYISTWPKSMILITALHTWPRAC